MSFTFCVDRVHIVWRNKLKKWLVKELQKVILKKLGAGVNINFLVWSLWIYQILFHGNLKYQSRNYRASLQKKTNLLIFITLFVGDVNFMQNLWISGIYWPWHFSTSYRRCKMWMGHGTVQKEFWKILKVRPKRCRSNAHNHWHLYVLSQAPLIFPWFLYQQSITCYQEWWNDEVGISADIFMITWSF